MTPDDLRILYTYLSPVLNEGLMEKIIPDKTRSRNHRYHLTLAGR